MGEVSDEIGHLLTLKLMGHWPSRPHLWPNCEVKIPIFGPVVLALFIHFHLLFYSFCQAHNSSASDIERS